MKNAQNISTTYISPPFLVSICVPGIISHAIIILYTLNAEFQAYSKALPKADKTSGKRGMIETYLGAISYGYSVPNPRQDNGCQAKKRMYDKQDFFYKNSNICKHLSVPFITCVFSLHLPSIFE